MNDVSKHLS